MIPPSIVGTSTEASKPRASGDDPYLIRRDDLEAW